MGDPHLYGWFMEKYGNIWMVYNGKNEKKPINGNNMEVSYGGSPFIWMVYGKIWKHMDGLQWKNEKKPINGNNMEVSYGGSPVIWMVYGKIWKHMDGLQWKK